ncbi:MAG TPA: response regulator [Sedimentisphaerales bacterium]|nr:response regulator [Sedimentisphaerales bacterium]
MARSLMIVDDSVTMRRIIMRTIRMSGIEFGTTEEAGNGAEALAKLRAGHIDVVLCDINMPEMTGSEMLKRLRTELPERAGTMVIMVSTESGQDLIDSIMASGANGYITKPFTPEKFAEKLKPLLN